VWDVSQHWIRQKQYTVQAFDFSHQILPANQIRTNRSDHLPANQFAVIGNTGVSMNIKGLGLPVALACCALLAGCSTATVVTLQNGTQYVTKDKPKTAGKDGFYEFQDISGKTVRVRSDEVATVKEED
jgi:hypothetical protein